MGIQGRRHERRQANLKRLIAENGGVNAFARIVEDAAERYGWKKATPRSHISRQQLGNAAIGDTLCEKYELAAGKPNGWMDEDETALSPEAAVLGAAFDHLPPGRAKEEYLWKLLGQMQVWRPGAPDDGNSPAPRPSSAPSAKRARSR